MMKFKEYLQEASQQKDPCQHGYRQFGVKDKNGKKVPNCVPEDIDEGDTLVFEDDTSWTVVSEAEYQGKEVQLNKPSKGDTKGKKQKVFVKNSDGKVIKVNFGDANMSIKKHIPANRKSFRARHNCDTATDKTSARYWSCRAW